MTEKRLTDFGLRLPRELGTDPAALAEALQSLPSEPTDDDRERFGDRVLAAMPPKRAADKRKAVAQRTSREAVDFEAAILEGLRKAEELPQSPGRYMCKRNGQWGEVEVLQDDRRLAVRRRRRLVLRGTVDGRPRRAEAAARRVGVVCASVSTS